jgi:hypothetical protein
MLKGKMPQNMVLEIWNFDSGIAEVWITPEQEDLF